MLEYFTAEHAESAENFFLNISHRGYRAHRDHTKIFFETELLMIFK